MNGEGFAYFRQAVLADELFEIERIDAWLILIEASKELNPDAWHNDPNLKIKVLEWPELPVSSGTAEQCRHNVRREACPQCTAVTVTDVHS